MNYILYILFGLLPSVIWLLFYLKKDSHPESNRMILKVFFWGMITAVLAAAAEVFLSTAMSLFLPESVVSSPLYFIFLTVVVVGLVEEIFKFLVVQIKVIKNKEFDEPVDAMIYMIVVALGFAALENLLYLSPVIAPGGNMPFANAAFISGFRFMGATFLHALASGTAGFFLALSICYPSKKRMFLAAGIGIASLLHGLFNISIIGIGAGMETGNGALTTISVLSLLSVLICLALFVSFGFTKLKKIKSICHQNFSKN